MTSLSRAVYPDPGLCGAGMTALLFLVYSDLGLVLFSVYTDPGLTSVWCQNDRVVVFSL